MVVLFNRSQTCSKVDGDTRRVLQLLAERYCDLSSSTGNPLRKKFNALLNNFGILKGSLLSHEETRNIFWIRSKFSLTVAPRK